MRKHNLINTKRGIMVAHEDGAIHEEFSDYSVIPINNKYFVVDKSGVIVDAAQDKAPLLFYVATQGDKLTEIEKNGVEINLASNKLDTEGLYGAIKMAIDSDAFEHIPNIMERLNQLPNKLIDVVNEPLKAREKQIAGVKATSGIHREKTVIEAIKTVNKVEEELNTFNSKADVYRSTGLDKKSVERAYKIVKKVKSVREYWLKFQGTMPYGTLISTIVDITGVHPTNVEDWISEFRSKNLKYFIET